MTNAYRFEVDARTNLDFINPLRTVYLNLHSPMPRRQLERVSKCLQQNPAIKIGTTFDTAILDALSDVVTRLELSVYHEVENIDPLARCTKLQSLRLQFWTKVPRVDGGTYLKPGEIRVPLQPAFTPPDLVALELRGIFVLRKTDVLGKCPRQLVVMDGSVDDDAFEGSRIENLRLQGTSGNLGFLRGLDTLLDLHVANCPAFADESLHHVSMLPRLRGLVLSDRTDRPLSLRQLEDSLVELLYIYGWPKLTELFCISHLENLKYMKLLHVPKEAIDFEAILKCPRLEELDIQGVVPSRLAGRFKQRWPDVRYELGCTSRHLTPLALHGPRPSPLDWLERPEWCAQVTEAYRAAWTSVADSVRSLSLPQGVELVEERPEEPTPEESPQEEWELIEYTARQDTEAFPVPPGASSKGPVQLPKTPMNEDIFWETIDESRFGIFDAEAQGKRLIESLEAMHPLNVAAFVKRFSDLMKLSCTWDLWGVAFIVMGRCNDQGFDDFRVWLIGQGREYFEAALANPEAAAQDVNPRADIVFEDFVAIARRVYRNNTGEDLAVAQWSDPSGAPFEFSDAELMARFPRVWKKFHP